ncbi:serine/threonine-protein kinase [Saccharothrix variisporea]|uniref:Serine/threonine protein kinase n=1 Tax=Saccharothrix variisporea TaxID=543527 RepID=A0A495WZN4_9PSEU|nr:serine/threonine-protein kinase [Saccharothrix variisporea]RKT67162.1 serine/threonine protein kinase [Saccharothrix variisporea]
MTAGFAPLTADDPTEVGGYELRARIGVGGMGRVYLAFTPGGRALAIKVVRSEHAEDEEFRRRFRQEVDIARRVQGLYTATVVDADPDAVLPWLATSYVSGPSVRQAVADHGPLPLPTVFRLLAGAAEGLSAIHACGLVHRDLTPANVLLADDGPRVIDFGIAHAAAATSLTRTGVQVGTPALMAPEQVRGKPATRATDVFALGQLAVFAATGHTAFGEGNPDALFYRILNEPPDLDDCPPELRPIAERCLAKDPDDRPELTEVIEYARARTHGQTVLLTTDSWLPDDLVTALVAFDPSAYQRTAVEPPQPRVPTAVLPPPGTNRGSVIAAIVGSALAVATVATVVAIGPGEILGAATGGSPTTTHRAETAGLGATDTTTREWTTTYDPPTTTTTTKGFDPTDLDSQTTDDTPQTTNALLADSFTAGGRTYTFEAGSDDVTCYAPAQTDQARRVLDEYDCIGATTGAYVSDDGTVLVSVKVFAFKDKATADNVYAAMKDFNTGDLGYVCPKEGRGSEPCDTSENGLMHGWTGSRHRYIVNTVATYVDIHDNPGDGEVLKAASEEGLNSAGPQNYR